MKHTPAEQLSWVDAGLEHFTGQVWFGALSHASPEGLNALGVMFEPGARTNWHTHPEGQVLYVVSGAGHVQKEDGESVTMGPGDVVYSPPREVHWHGASSDSFMVHLSLTTGGATEWLDRAVTDEEHSSAH